MDISLLLITPMKTIRGRGNTKSRLRIAARAAFFRNWTLAYVVSSSAALRLSALVFGRTVG